MLSMNYLESIWYAADVWLTMMTRPGSDENADGGWRSDVTHGSYAVSMRDITDGCWLETHISRSLTKSQIYIHPRDRGTSFAQFHILGVEPVALCEAKTNASKRRFLNHIWNEYLACYIRFILKLAGLVQDKAGKGIRSGFSISNRMCLFIWHFNITTLSNHWLY